MYNLRLKNRIQNAILFSSKSHPKGFFLKLYKLYTFKLSTDNYLSISGIT